jgi:hypothetical protein
MTLKVSEAKALVAWFSSCKYRGTSKAASSFGYDKMLELYPNRANPGSLWGSARAAKG